MKKFVNSKVFVFILGIVVCSATTALASTMLARNIAYTPKDAKWKVDNVEAAIDSLMLSKTETDYSTEERVVGTWVDGKKLYQKTLTKRITSNGKTIIEQLDSNINVVSIDGILLLDSGFKNSINSYYTTGYYNMVECRSNNEVQILLEGWYPATAYVTIQYTKTTDSAN